MREHYEGCKGTAYFPAFLRRNNKIQLTEEGWFVQERIDGILKSMDTLNRDLNDFVGQKNHIRLGVPLQIGSFLLPLLFGKFRQEYPDICLEIEESGAIDIVKKLLDDQLDLAILSVDTSRTWDVEWTHLYNSEFCFCVSKDHELAKKESVSFQEACSCPLVVFKEGFYINGNQSAAYHQKSGDPGWLRGISAPGRSPHG